MKKEIVSHRLSESREDDAKRSFLRLTDNQLIARRLRYAPIRHHQPAVCHPLGKYHEVNYLAAKNKSNGNILGNRLQCIA